MHFNENQRLRIEFGEKWNARSGENSITASLENSKVKENATQKGHVTHLDDPEPKWKSNNKGLVEDPVHKNCCGWCPLKQDCLPRAKGQE